MQLTNSDDVHKNKRTLRRVTSLLLNWASEKMLFGVVYNGWWLSYLDMLAVVAVVDGQAGGLPAQVQVICRVVGRLGMVAAVVTAAASQAGRERHRRPGPGDRLPLSRRLHPVTCVDHQTLPILPAAIQIQIPTLNTQRRNNQQLENCQSQRGPLKGQCHS